MATATVGVAQHHPASRMGQETEGAALKTVHFQSLEKDAVPSSVSEKHSERFLPPIEDKKAAKEGTSKVVCARNNYFLLFDSYFIDVSLVFFRPTLSQTACLKSCC